MKSISGVTLSKSAPGRIKCPYFGNIISPTIKKCKWLKLKRLCTGNDNEHVIQSFEVFLLRQNKFLSIYLPVATRSEAGKINIFSKILTHTTVDVFHKNNVGLWMEFASFETLEYTNDRSPDACIILTFQNKFL